MGLLTMALEFGLYLPRLIKEIFPLTFICSTLMKTSIIELSFRT